MASVQLRIFLLALFIVLSYVLWHKENLTLTPIGRRSRWRQKSKVGLTQSHLGLLSEFQVKPRPLFADSSLLEWINFDKKVNTYHFTFYNWYHFDLRFEDLGYQSNLQFRSFGEDHLDQRWTERVGFALDDSFYPQGGKIKLPNNEGDKSSGKEQGLNFDFSSNVLNISVRQYTTKNLSDDRHDGYKYSRFWYYTPNKSLDDPSNQAFKSDLTITSFSIKYIREDIKFDANITHVLRHNQCFSAIDEENQGVFKHNCYGGYGNGKILIERKEKHLSSPDYGKWVNSVYNLNNNRTRTFFEGARSTAQLTKKIGALAWPKTNWHWRGFKAYMQGFSKPQYYSKQEKIQKQRYVGLHISRPFSPIAVENFEDYFFFNGKIHPLINIDYSFSQQYRIGKNITFKAAPVAEGKWQPDFQAVFNIIGTEQVTESMWLSQRNEIRVYGFWSGYVDEGERGERVNFFNITGFIQTTNSIY